MKFLRIKLVTLLFLLVFLFLSCGGDKDKPASKLQEAIKNISNMEEVQTTIEKQVLSESIAVIKKSADVGHVEAMYWMSEGRLLDATDPNFVSVKTSVTWLEKAAQKGHLDALLSLGALFSSNQDVKNTEKAYMWYYISFYKKNTAKKNTKTEIDKVVKLEFQSESDVETLVKELGQDKLKELESEAKQWIAKYKAK